MGISIGQLLIILLIVALLFGTKKLRNIGGDLGSAIKSFRSAMKDSDHDDISQNSSVIEGKKGEDDTDKESSNDKS